MTRTPVDGVRQVMSNIEEVQRKTTLSDAVWVGSTTNEWAWMRGQCNKLSSMAVKQLMNALAKLATQTKNSNDASPAKNDMQSPEIWAGDDVWNNEDMMEELDALNAMLLEASAVMPPEINNSRQQLNLASAAAMTGDGRVSTPVNNKQTIKGGANIMRDHSSPKTSMATLHACKNNKTKKVK